ncbi:MAG: aminotransferase class I/II-fold pyridoxal phosphate-dependent enzyme [Vampirovibrionales bacterium]|nr:aminotransferase class I/II-fold pyridoxal phosphate-dependent enzyme [Vampirovibrionales bacterium]
MTIAPRAAVAAMSAYSAPLEGRREQIRLDFNENTTGFAQAAAPLDAAFLGAYPEYDAFTAALAAYFGREPQELLLTNGSAEALFLLPFVFIEPGRDVAVVSTPTFPVIPHSLALAGARIHAVPMRADLTYDLAGLEQALQTGARLCTLATPDNPSGATIASAVILDWAQRFTDTLFVIDEAYIEYGGESVLAQAGVMPNLVVTRSFSKAWGMAALRLGVAIGHPEVIAWLRVARSPYSVNALAVQTAGRLLENPQQVADQAQATLRRKALVLAAVAERGYGAIAGAANFFLLKVGLDAGALCDFCRARGVLLRDRSSLPNMGGLVRVSVGTEAEMDAFLACLDAFRAERALMFDLDDTLVDVSRSYDEVVMRVVAHFGVERPDRQTILALKAEGGFNDDWDAARELLRRAGKDVSREAIVALAKPLYLSLARDHESWPTAPEALRAFSKRYRTLVVTGRPRDEYAPVWGERLDACVERVFCQDDFDGAGSALPRKPAPDLLKAAMAARGVCGGAYVGNSVDDMAAARAAGLRAWGVATTHSPEALAQAGAERVFQSIPQLQEALMI